MKIKYYLLDNPMTPDSNDRRAQVVDFEIVEEKDIYEYISRPGSGITLAEAKANYEEIVSVHEYFLKQGYGIRTEFLIIHPTMQGVYRSDDDKFDRNRHAIKFKARLGKRYNRTADDVQVEKISAPIHLPSPTSVEDIASATINETLTSGGVATLKGTNLKFKQDDLQQGIFLISSSKNEYRVERILNQTSKQVIFQIPANLPSDDYVLEVRLLMRGTKSLKTNTLRDVLTV
jgi:hypothetical protein